MKTKTSSFIQRLSMTGSRFLRILQGKNSLSPEAKKKVNEVVERAGKKKRIDNMAEK